MLVVGCRSVLTLFWNASSRFTVVRIFLRNRVAIWPSELSLRTSSCGACLDHGVYCGVSLHSMALFATKEKFIWAINSQGTGC